MLMKRYLDSWAECVLQPSPKHTRTKLTNGCDFLSYSEAGGQRLNNNKNSLLLSPLQVKDTIFR